MKKITVLKIVFTALAIVVNITGSNLTDLTIFPLYMDSLLTIAVAAFCGPFYAIFCAVCSNSILSLIANLRLPFMLCHVSTAVLSSLVFAHETKKFPNENNHVYSIECFLWAGLWCAISNALLGNIISDILYTAKTFRQHLDILVEGFYILTRNTTLSAYCSGTLSNMTDKMISAILSYCVYLILHKLSSRQ